jgi:small-conductance mechanosensitive channel
LKRFIAAIGERSKTAINPESIEQLEIEEEVYRNVTSDTVIAEAEKRIEKYCFPDAG